MRALKLGMYGIGAAFSLLYLMNPGAGVFELVPDQLPIVGHVDEAAMVALLLSCTRAMRRLRSESAQQRDAPAMGADTIR